MASAASSAPDETWRLLTPARRMIAAVILSVSNFMVLLDMTVANVSVPHISGDLGASLDQGAWVITSYAVAEAITVPLTGWLAQRFGTVRLLLLSIAGFAAFSLLCGISLTLPMLVLCRVGQGLCGGPMIPMSQTLMMRLFPPEKRAMSMGIWAMTVTVAPAVGPIVGGMLNDQLSWHWIFFINVPLVVPCILGIVALMGPLETPVVRVPIDRVGLALMVFWIGCLQLMLDLGRDRDWFASSLILGLGLGGLIGFVVFVVWELTEEHPVVDLRIFRNAGFSISVAVQSLAFGAFFAGVVVVPQWAQATLGYTATKAGIVSAAHAIAALLVSRFVPGLVQRFGTRLVVSAGCLWMGAAAIVRTLWTSDIDMTTLWFTMFLQGFGNPLMMIPLVGISITLVKPSQAASAAGLVNFVRSVALAVATSLVLTDWGNSQSEKRANLVGALHDAPLRASLADLGWSSRQATALIDRLVEKEAVTLAVDHVFWVIAAILFFAAALIWLAPIPRRAATPPAAGH